MGSLRAVRRARREGDAPILIDPDRVDRRVADRGITNEREPAPSDRL
jgi:hypothetical protein